MFVVLYEVDDDLVFVVDDDAVVTFDDAIDVFAILRHFTVCVVAHVLWILLYLL